MNKINSCERAGRFLSFQLKQSAAAGFIPAIRKCDGNIITDQQGINDEFTFFYETLYSSEVNDTGQIEGFVSKLEMPFLEDSDKSALEGNITVFEIDSAIKKLNSGKAPGPDGYPAEFYKTFSAKLAPLLCKVFEEARVSNSLPLSIYIYI